jgi:hypothetical protein
MRSLRQVLGATLLATSLAAGPAAALPDYVPITPAGWSAPIVLRTAGDATGGNALDSPTLAGDGTSFYNAALRNTGASAGTANTSFSLRVDGVERFSFLVNALGVGSTGFATNQSLSIPGGLHTASSMADAGGVMPESNETNNEYGRQLAFTPVNLAAGTKVIRAAPPAPLGGTATVGGTIYSNKDGVRLPASDQPWDAVALRPGNEDYDLGLYAATTGIANGFRTALKTSELGAGVTDFIINNGNFPGAPAHDAGVLYFSGASQPYGVEHRQKPAGSLTIGNTYAGLSLATEQMLYIHQYQHVPSGSVPRVLFELTGTPGQVLHLALFNASTVIASRSEAMGDAVTDADGRAFLDMSLETMGANKLYGIVVYRDVDGGTAPVTFTLRIRATPADLSNERNPFNTVPVNASNAGFNSTTEPTALDGNVANTTMTYYYFNSGAQVANGFHERLFLDGAEIAAYGPGSINPEIFLYYGEGPTTVRGGRHTLSYQTDVTDVIDETSETNNDYGKQFVWSPLAMSPGVPVTRAMPPDPAGGWGEIPVSVTRYNNVDGLRTNFPGRNYTCLATALVPGAGSDVDLEWFTMSTGPLDGFTTPLVISERSDDLTDLVVEYREAARGSYDIGARRYSGPDVPYTVQTVQSGAAFIDPPVIGPATIAPGAIVQAFAFFRDSNSPSMTVVLENLSGSADLGMSVYKFGVAQPPGNMDSTLPGGNVDGGGPGSSEVVVINQNLAGTAIGIVVWKKGAAELGKNSTFQLRIDPNVSGVFDPLPRALSFSVGGGNPARSTTQLLFDLPEARDVSLEVMDVQGRRVRTLATGPQTAGSHSVDWNGTDEQGRRVANGTYFVRFSSGDFRRVTKVSLLR